MGSVASSDMDRKIQMADRCYIFFIKRRPALESLFAVTMYQRVFSSFSTAPKRYLLLPFILIYASLRYQLEDTFFLRYLKIFSIFGTNLITYLKTVVWLSTIPLAVIKFQRIR